MTENVSWYLAIILLMFQEVLAMSSPSGWRTSLAMSIRSIPGRKHNTVNKNFPTKTLNRVKSQTPTGCEELPCSRNHHHSAVWVSCDRIKAIHHLTADRRRQNRCEDDVPGTSDRPVNVSVTRFVPPEGFVHGVAFLRTVQLHMCDELCRLTDGQRSVRRSRTA